MQLIGETMRSEFVTEGWNEIVEGIELAHWVQWRIFVGTASNVWDQ